MDAEQLYPEAFYAQLREGSRASAQEIVPLLLALIQPASVVDVGCGSGTWLSVFRKTGINDVLGIDGDHVPRASLEIPQDQFHPFDLTAPLRVGRHFDLVLSFEVAEHLPASGAATFVDSLVHLGKVIVFSAAIPQQGGEGHVNEQWPEYWIEKFQQRGYEVIDCIRDKVWSNKRVEWWYAQNTFLFVEGQHLKFNPRLNRERAGSCISQFSLVHPRHYLHSKWKQDVLLAVVDIVDVIPKGKTFVLVDEHQFGYEFAPKRQVLRFPEHEDWYWRTPSDEQAAIRELERLRRNGADYAVIGWPAFGWLELRPQLKQRLLSNYRTLLKNERALVFDIRR